MATHVIEDDDVSSEDDSEPTEADAVAQKRYDYWLGRIAACHQVKTRIIPEWSENVDYRRGKPFDDDSDNDRIQVTVDWTATKAKQSQLFSQVPEIRLQAHDKGYEAAAPMFAKKVNGVLCKARVGVAMDEALPDNINAAGIGVVMCGVETLSVMKDMPPEGMDQSTMLAFQAKGIKVATRPTPQVTDKRFYTTRLSPADLLWDTTFTGSDFDDSGWAGNDGRMTEEEGAQQLGLTPAQLKQVVMGDARKTTDRISSSTDINKQRAPKVINYQQIFYWKHKYDKGATSYDEIQHLVFVKGLRKPVVDKPWDGQKFIPLPDGTQHLVGARKLPIRVLTLTYITDECIPPSDSAMGRPTVNELNRSRSQMIRNREASVPLRWYNVNLVDPQVATQLLRGTWQGFIPMNGRGDAAIGEVARASFPPEDMAFDNIAKQDLRNTWQVEDAFNDGPQIRSATEAQNRQTNFQTRIGYERARVGSFFVGIAEVMAGLVALHGDFTQEEQKLLGALPKEMLSDYYAFNIRSDSTLLLDANQRIDRLMHILDMTAKSGVVNVIEIVTEIHELAGLDTTKTIKQPEPPSPEPLSISLRLTGAADLSSPTVIALLMKADQLPSPEQMNAAKVFLAAMQIQPTGPGAPVPGAPPAPPPGAPQPDGGPEGAPPAGGPPPAPGAPPAPPVPTTDRPKATQPPYTSHPDFNTAGRVNKRKDDGK